MDDLLSEFLTETAENLEIVDAELVKLERDPGNKDTLGRIFRLVHTIKGTCGFLGLSRLEKVAHAGETMLGKFRDGALAVTPPAVTLILDSLDSIKVILAHLAATGAEPDGEDSALIAKLEQGARGQFAAPPVAAAPAPEPAARALKPGEVDLDELERAFRDAPGPDAPAAPVAAAAVAEPPKADAAAEIGRETIRVSVQVLESLMTMVSELVLTRNQLLDMVRRLDDSDFKAPLQRLSAVTAELQESVMKARMQPIGNAWGKLPRVVRDLANELGKKIELRMTGAETELDRQVLELIKDPLTHMVRNSADHGLETPEDRRRAGKGDTGIINLHAYHEGGHIIIEIRDDGRGLNTEKIKAKALKAGIVSEADLAAMSEDRIHQFVFAAGFSTAEKVTNVSGRGVGMDVVRTNIDAIGGTVTLKSVAGKGSAFTIKIPLTLAIVSSLIVGAGGMRFALPQTCVSELVRASSRSEHRIETINATPVLRLRERLTPLVYLSEVLGLGEAVTPEEAFVVVCKTGQHTFGIVVDAVHDTEEIVVKPLSQMLRDVRVFSGTTILGDGSVIMILDPNGLAASIARDTVNRIGSEAGQQVKAQGDARISGAGGPVSILIFRAGGPEPKCLPLSLVTRLEEIDASRIEYAEGRALVQYRGRLMQLMTVSPAQSLRTEGKQAILVFSDETRVAGLAVDEIVDIVDERLDIVIRSIQPGIAGTAIVKGQASEVIDTAHFITRAFPDWFDRVSAAARETRPRVLLVDDSAFFRNMMSPLLSAAGYDVVPAEGPEAALALREAGERFDVIVSDIEMPGMDGLAFAERVRADAQWSETPLFAITSRIQPDDVAKGLTAGFSDYFAKSDRERLIAKLDETFQTMRAA